MNKLILKSLIITAILLFGGQSIKAQMSDLSLGLRMGSYNGIAAKMEFDKPISFEMILGTKNHGLTATFLLELNRPVDFFWSRGFWWYYGVGTHFGYIRTTDLKDYFNNSPQFSYEQTYTVPAAGVDGVIGIFYRFNELPLEISLDTKPLLEIINVKRLHLRVFETALTVRYKFNNQNF